MQESELSPGGRAVELLEELYESGFITTSSFFGRKVKTHQYRLVDEYSHFYLSWIDDDKHTILQLSVLNLKNYG